MVAIYLNLPLENSTRLRRFLKITGRAILILLGIIILLFIAIQTSPVQNWLAKKAASRLSKDLNTEVTIKRVSFSLLNRMDLEGLMIRDQKKDTLVYAGALKVRITDWFIFKDQADLKYIGLEDAVIKTNRTDSIWNYKFIADYFSSPSSSKKIDTSKKKGIDLDLKKIDFKNVRFVQEDKWRGETMKLNVASLLMNANKVDFEKGNLDIDDLTIDKPVFGIYNYTGNRKIIPEGKGFSLDIGVNLKVAALTLTNATFINDKETERPVHAYFDGAHIIVTKLNGTIKNLAFTGDTVRGKVDISARERSGFELKRLKADFKFNTEVMEFANLDLQTPKSRIRDYYSMKYTDFEDDMSEFVDNVIINARFKQADINSDDIAYFDPQFKTWKKEITASGNFKGTVNNFNGSEVYVKSGNSTITGNVAIKGTTNINTAVLSLTNGTVTTTYNDLALYVPEIKEVQTPDLKSLGTVRFSGNFNGTIRKFTAKGNLNTSLGNAYTDISMNLPVKGVPAYTGAINTQKFNLGKFLDIDGLGYVSLNGKVNGAGFSKASVKTSFDGNIGELNYGNYTFRNIIANGTFQKGAFAGEVKMNDPNLNFTSNINIDFNGAQPRFIVLGDVAKANLQALQLTKDKFDLAGLLDVDFTGTNIDNFIGYAKLINASLSHDSTRLAFDSLSLQTELIENRKLLTIKSNEIDATVRGQYNILDLPNSIQSYLHNYFPSYIGPPSKIPQDQRFGIRITTRNISDYINIFDPRLSGFDNSTISGRVNTTRPDSGFSITTNVPYFRYDKATFSGVQFKGVGDTKSLNLNGDVDLVTYGDSLYFPNTKINIQSADDVSLVSVKTKANNTLNEADLNATVRTFEDGVQINFKPSSFVINDEKWTLEKEGELTLRRNFVAARDIKFTQGYQEVTVSTRIPEGGSVAELVVNLKNLHLGDFIRFVTKEPQMQGLVSGEVVVTDIFDQLSARAILQAQEFRLDNDSLGLVQIDGGYSKKTGIVNYTIITPNPLYNLKLVGTYNTNDSTVNPLSTTLQLNNTKIDFINRFLGSIFSDIDGYATGDVQLIGNFNHPQLLGKAKIKNAGFKVKYTQVFYTIDEADIDFLEDRIEFGQFILKDKFNNTGFARGILYENAFQNMRFDFDLSTNKMLLLDTKLTDNQNFYGKAVGKATLNIRGPEDNIQMNISGELNDTSHIFIPTSNSKESGEADFIVFKQPGKEVKAAVNASTNLTVDLDVTATNKAAIDLILDPLAGDVLKARGNGRLRIHAGTTDKVTMNGRYNIEQGDYVFNFQSLLRKPFEVDTRSANYLEWTGDPYAAEIHVDVMYTAEKVSLNDLLGKIDLGSAAKYYRGNVNVIASLRNKLTEPKTTFRLDFPGNEFQNDELFNAFLTKLQSDENEMNKQVTYLLLFNSFAPYGEGKNVTQNLYSYAYKGLSDIINRQLNGIVNNILYQVFKDKSLKVDVSTSFYSSSALLGNTTGVSPLGSLSNIDRSNLNLKLVKSFLNGRIVINVGGNLDFGFVSSTAFQNGNIQLLPDWNVEFILGRTGKLRMVVFQRNSLDINTANNSSSLGRRNRYGISLTLSKDLD